ncbi:MAG TPA: FKBP-type peptidyl-prolyl cis-trans isomerase [Vicinamibacterales bacterium]|nr:FKBP-type peptidyl-prolyl cis-trans isomerase [Vicinamibacterales bacterium]
MTRRIMLAALLASAVACGGSDSSSSSPTAPSTSSGTYTQTDLVVGTGAVANSGNRVTVSYTGWLYDTSKPLGKGNQFDSNNITFVLGTGAVIRGWDQGVAGMRVGGQRRLIIPPELAYGASSPDPTRIPPNATLLFDITLLNVQ